MATLLFCVLHLAALFAFAPALFVTIPLHVIYTLMNRRTIASDIPSPKTHHRCPDCRELILIGANVCKHCGARIETK